MSKKDSIKNNVFQFNALAAIYVRKCFPSIFTSYLYSSAGNSCISIKLVKNTSSVTWPTVKPVGLEDGLKDVTYVWWNFFSQHRALCIYLNQDTPSGLYRCARKQLLCDPTMNSFSGAGYSAKSGITYSQTVLPSGVTSNNLPNALSQINVFPFQRRCDPLM